MRAVETDAPAKRRGGGGRASRCSRRRWRRNLATRDGASYAPIIWVSQQASGTSFDSGLDEDGRKALGKRLGELSGITLGTLAGGAFEQALEHSYEELFTAKTRKESDSEASPLHRARVELASAQSELQQAEALRKSREADLDEYAGVVEGIRAIERQLPEFESAVVAADGLLDKAEKVRGKMLEFGREAGEAKARATYQEQVVRRREDLRDRTKRTSADFDASAKAVEQARVVLAAHEAKRARRCSRAALPLEARLDEAAMAIRRLQGQGQLASLRERAGQDAARLAKARAARADLIAARVRVAAIRVDDAARE